MTRYASLWIGLAVSMGAPAVKDSLKKEPTIVGELVGEQAVAAGMNVLIPEGGSRFHSTPTGP